MNFNGSYLLLDSLGFLLGLVSIDVVVSSSGAALLDAEDAFPAVSTTALSVLVTAAGLLAVVEVAGVVTAVGLSAATGAPLVVFVLALVVVAAAFCALGAGEVATGGGGGGGG